MKRRLCLLVLNSSPQVERYLDSVGVWYEVKPTLAPNLQNYALLFLNGQIDDKRTWSIVNEYLESGGSVLETGITPQFYKRETKKAFVKRLLFDDENSSLHRTRFTDIYSNLSFISSKNGSHQIFDFESTSNEGYIGYLGLDLNQVLNYKGYIRKRFSFKDRNGPDEIVSKRSYQNICDIIDTSIEKMFHLQGLPFIKKWNSPTKKPVFGFRIDTDFGDRDSLSEIYELLTKQNLSATWFLHVEAHKDYLEYFSTFKNQELALHGDQHGTSESAKKTETNIRKGLESLQESGIYPDGYCTPYAIWNDALKESLQRFDFEYSSEFTRAYDCNPFIDESDHLQIPIHPICTGSLNRLGYSEQVMQEYFTLVYQSKINLWKPVLFYHHPMQPGLEVFEEIFDKANEDQLCNLTFLEFARFWRDRDKYTFEAYCDDNTVYLESKTVDHLMYLSNKTGAFNLFDGSTKSLSKDFESPFKYDLSYLPSATEVEQLLEKQFRLLKTSLFDWKNRKRL